MTKKQTIIVACSIFAQELQAVLSSDLKSNIIWIDAGLHADLQCLEKELTNTLKRGQIIAADIRLFFGNGCHPDIGDIARRFDARLSPAKNCIDAFCGEKAKYIEQNKTMIMTPGWIRAWPNIMKSLGWTKVDVRINLGRYDKILLLDAGVGPLTDEEILMFFDLTQIPIEVEHLSLDHFKCVLEDLLQ